MLFNKQLERESYTFTIKCVDGEQVFIVVSMKNTDNCTEDFRQAYEDILSLMRKYDINMFHERIYGSNIYCGEIKRIRSYLLEKYEMEKTTYTYLEGNPYWGKGIAGIHIHGIMLSMHASMRAISYKNNHYGFVWDNGKEEYLVLHNIVTKESEEGNKYEEFISMFEAAQDILKRNGFQFNEVIRTWIYFNNILEDYEMFNKSRTNFFIKYGILPDSNDKASSQKTFIPASTGIGCGNPDDRTAVMDVLAVKKKNNSELSIRQETGTEQKAAFQYGSAFSRAMVLKKKGNKQLFLSGTASIDPEGRTLHKGDFEGQASTTFKVIYSLAKIAQISLENMCESTVFLKKAEYYPVYRKYLDTNEWGYLPAIIIVADVCRNELLFELDATFIV